MSDRSRNGCQLRTAHVGRRRSRPLWVSCHVQSDLERCAIKCAPKKDMEGEPTRADDAIGRAALRQTMKPLMKFYGALRTAMMWGRKFRSVLYE